MKLQSTFFKKLARPLIVVTLVGLTLTYQNCGKLDVADDRPNAPSPFENKGIALSPRLKNEKLIPASTTLNFIVEDECIQARKSRNSTRYFLDRFSNVVRTDQVGLKFSQSLIPVTLNQAIDTKDLERIKTTDKCIVGISDDQGVEFALAAASDYNDPGVPQQSYLQRSGFFNSYPAFQNQLAPQSVTVAVIDTGFDMTRPDGVVFADLLVGSNRLNGGSVPQDDNGHGTSIGSLIAARGNNGTGIVGAAGHASKLLPLRIIGGADPKTNLSDVFAAVKHAVNAGADVVNISLGNPVTNPDDSIPIVCDPTIGHLIYKAIENRTFLVMSAGNFMRCETVNGVRRCYPGETFSPKDNSFDELSKDTFAPACWGRYFKGALSVTSVDANGRLPAAFGNWGKDSVEVAAPGTAIYAQGLNGAYANKEGTSFSTALVTAAVANTIAFYKKQGWYYNPWIIEDTLLNGLPSDANLQDGRGSLVRLNKTLNFSSLANYLTSLIGSTDEERRRQFSDNPESGVVRNLAGAPARGQIIKLDIYTKEPLMFVKDQAQIQAVAYYDNADLEVVSDKVQWSVNKTGASITSSGIFIPSVAGQYTVTANYNGRTGTTGIAVSSASVVTGTAGELLNIQAIPKPTSISGSQGFRLNFVSCDIVAEMQIRATYSDGTIRYVPGEQGTHFLFAKNGATFIAKDQWSLAIDGKPFFFPGREMVVVTLYRGKRTETSFTLSPNPDRKTNFTFSGALSVNEGAKTADVWIEAALARGSYNPFVSISGFGRGWPEMVAPPNCYSTEIVRQNAFPADPNQRVLNQSYPISISYNYWGNARKEAISETWQQIAVANRPIAIEFGRRSGTGSNLTFTSTTDFAPAEKKFFWASGVYKFANGTFQNLTEADVSFKVLSNDPIAAACNAYVDPNVSLETKWNAASYYQPGTVNIEVRDTRYGLTTVAPMRSTEPNWTAARTASRTIASVNAAAPPVPAANPNCSANLPFAAGDGSLNNPFLICTLQQLKSMKSRTGKEHFQLGASLDLATLTLADLPLPFHILDGKGHWLRNLILTDAERHINLLVATNTTSQVKDLNFDNVNIRAKDRTGVFEITALIGGIGIGRASLTNIYISNSKLIGGGALVGSRVDNVVNVRGVNLEIGVDCTFACQVGGLVLNANSVKNSYFQGKIGFLSPGNLSNIGGIAAIISNVAEDNTVEAEIRSGPNSAAIGGIAGSLSGSVQRNKFTGSVLGVNAGTVGGIVGSTGNGTFSGNYVDAQLEGAGAVGGIVGTIRAPAGFFGNISRGRITAKKSAGGMVGKMDHARFEENSAGMLVACQEPATCGAFIGDLKHLPNCPTLPNLVNNRIEVGSANGLAPIGSGPQGGRVAPIGIVGDVRP